MFMLLLRKQFISTLFLRMNFWEFFSFYLYFSGYFLMDLGLPFLLYFIHSLTVEENLCYVILIILCSSVCSFTSLASIV